MLLLQLYKVTGQMKHDCHRSENNCVHRNVVTQPKRAKNDAANINRNRMK